MERINPRIVDHDRQATDPLLSLYAPLAETRSHLRIWSRNESPSRTSDVARINILVAATSSDLKAQVIAEAAAARSDMDLLENRVVQAEDIEAILDSRPRSGRCVLVLVGRPVETGELAQRLLVQRADLIVLQVDIVWDGVQIGLRDPRLH